LIKAVEAVHLLALGLIAGCEILQQLLCYSIGHIEQGCELEVARSVWLPHTLPHIAWSPPSRVVPLASFGTKQAQEIGQFLSRKSDIRQKALLEERANEEPGPSHKETTKE
jgi:hypothetical protein